MMEASVRESLLPEVVSPSQARILDAARDLFFENGFSSVSTEQLSRAASVSKSSIYKYFKNMEGVLTAIVVRAGEALTLDIVPVGDTARDFWRSLTSYGANLVTLLNEDFCVKLDRLLHEEARHHPKLAQLYYEAAYGRAHRETARLIAHGQSCGFITRPQSAADLADNLVSMWHGLAYCRTRLGIITQPDFSSSAWAEQCVRALFSDQLIEQ